MCHSHSTVPALSHSSQASQAPSTDQRDCPPQIKTETSTHEDSTEQLGGLAAAYFEKPETESDIVAKGWALKLNRLPQDQRRFAEKIINDTLFEAELGNLTRHGVHFLSSTCIGNHCCQK
ncbi:uncharacterized protein LOC143210759 [Lasioglossum baleicum]|uniref:uncharacterized protein LOC143210759 n=1 Tax=Lasioglossum baleicum TaxID=434251 RepID=UPI003FCC937F